MKRFTTIDGLSLGAIGLTDAVTVALYGSLPARVPTHFDLRGVADGFMDRRTGAFLLPAFAAAMWLVLRWSPFLLPRAWHERLDASPVGALLPSSAHRAGVKLLTCDHDRSHTRPTAGRFDRHSRSLIGRYVDLGAAEHTGVFAVAEEHRPHHRPNRKRR